MSNKAFQSKVAGVPGGAELLVAAGYEYRTCTAGAGTGTGAASAAGTSNGTGATGASEEDQEELYLVHSMSSEGRSKLRYTLSRFVTHVQQQLVLLDINETSCDVCYSSLQDTRAAGVCWWWNNVPKESKATEQLNHARIEYYAFLFTPCFCIHLMPQRAVVITMARKG